YCYGRNVQDPEFSQGCNDKEPSFMDLQAHSAPLGLAFNYGKDFHVSYYGDLFVAYHGSWNRKEKTGYKIVRVKLGENKVEDFATGWLKDGKVLGRPVDIVFDRNGIMYVSDDFTGMIYRISFDRKGLI
ncbi:sorbosone dehydrogenase family protein, partial [Candidatus Woesearchaeota archaeon]|nr:sorbosone dehydrogenase family protein [Candidatus Woesearchaeota archaeon]